MQRLSFFVLAVLLVGSTVAGAQLPAHSSNEQILHAIHQANDLLNVSEQAWVDVVAVLIAKGADVNAPDGIGLTPLHYASMADYGDTAIVQQLLAAGAKRDAKDPEGHTPLQTAEKFHYVKLASALH